VEDEPFLAKIVRETLEGKGYEVKHVLNGNNAIPNFKAFQPDICVLDVMLPGKDGFAIGSEIRDLNREIPIIFLTAKDQTEDVLKGFTSGGNDYVRKPFSMEELMVRIENLLQLKNTGTQNSGLESIQLGLLKFNVHKMEIVTPKEILRLSHRESQILKLLSQDINGQVDRKKILLEIWGDDSFFNSRNLDVYIRKIRKYLSADPSIQLLTLKGIGYRLVS
jgi:DNA-binding response OmpR family regulator